jgi:hypothetical protein
LKMYDYSNVMAMKSSPSLAAQSNSIDFSPRLLVELVDPLSLQAELRYNIDFCAANKLTQSRKWLCELLVARHVKPDNQFRKQQPIFNCGIYKAGSVFYEEHSDELD